MKLSFNWLKEYIDLPVSPRELADIMTMAGLEVEDIIETASSIPDGIIVAEILERKPHPDAEKLSVCKVFTGSEELQIVCGAPNCDKGNKVPLATVGTVFTNTDSGKKLKIKKSKLRGVESFGMLCSSDELGLDNDHDGLLVLNDDSVVGTPILQCLNADTVYELEITPNRPDWLSHWGVARDLVPLVEQKTSFPLFSKPEPEKVENFDSLVTVDDSELCPRYTARIIRNVKIAESPDWLKEKLRSVGLRPINNIVDITNFVLMELGHPLHAFDLNKLNEKRVVVRRAKNGEKMITLDDSEISLNENNLVICDSEKPVALAGIMGGRDSGVTEQTVDILLESAVFNTSNIRFTSKQTKISSDSSFRFERGVDWNMCEIASERAASLILELAGGSLVSDLMDLASEKPQMPQVQCRFKKIRAILGAEIENQQIVEIFSGLNFSVENITDDSCSVIPPSYRLDIYREADLAEEVARIYGLDNIPVSRPRAISGGPMRNDAYYKLAEIGNELIGLGLNECMNYSLINSDKALVDSRFDESDLITLQNPLSLELAALRPSLLPQMLETIERNIARKNSNLALFEKGKVFCANSDLFQEERIECCIALTGLKYPDRFSSEKKVEFDFFDLKGIIESWFVKRKTSVVFRKPSENNKHLDNFVKGTVAEIIFHGKNIGYCGQIPSRMTKKMRINAPIFIALLDITQIINSKNNAVEFKKIPEYPSTSRDIAFLADKSLEHGMVINSIKKAKVKNLEKIELFDIFEDDKLFGSDKKSMAYSLTYRHKERTLTDKEVNAAHDKLRAYLAEKLPLDLR